MTLDEMRDLKVGDVVYRRDYYAKYCLNVQVVKVTDIGVYTRRGRKVLVNAQSKAFDRWYSKRNIFLRILYSRIDRNDAYETTLSFRDYDYISKSPHRFGEL
jgi:hypothetical protein